MHKAQISHIQRFSTADGPGIRTTVFFQGCNLRCAWCHNPETIGPGGRMYTLDEVLSVLNEDRPFYEASGGGITLSGGEPLLQADFCAALAEACAPLGMPVLVQTAGCVGYEAFQKVRPFIRQFYFDVKAADEEDYRSHTKGSLALVLENLARLVSDGADVTARIPIIPGLSDNTAYCRRLAEVLRPTGVSNLHLLPFHRLGVGKYRALGQKYSYAETRPPSAETMRELLEVFTADFKAMIEG